MKAAYASSAPAFTREGQVLALVQQPHRRGGVVLPERELAVDQ
jgi:hypothetical protein